MSWTWSLVAGWVWAAPEPRCPLSSANLRHSLNLMSPVSSSMKGIFLLPKKVCQEGKLEPGMDGDNQDRAFPTLQQFAPTVGNRASREPRAGPAPPASSGAGLRGPTTHPPGPGRAVGCAAEGGPHLSWSQERLGE